MEVEFKSHSFAFLADFNDSPVAKKVIESLPVAAEVSIRGDGLIFYTGIEVPPGKKDTVVGVDVGDVLYCFNDKALLVVCYSINSIIAESHISQFPFVIVGKSLVSSDELREILSAEQVSIFVKKKSYTSGERILSQGEVDSIVQELLAKKKSG